MAGTINLSLSQQFDMDGRPLSGGFLYFFVAGTTTPQNAFQDEALAIVHPNPITLDASGRVPMFYLADGHIKIRLADENGVTVIAADNLLVIGPSTTGGAASSVDATTLMATGDIKARYGTGPLTGYVRCNGNSIGKAGSGATESASAGTQALFEYLWQFANITLDTAKGGSATADFTAGRKLNLPDLRGRTIAGMDDMGASAAGRLTSASLGVSGTTIGNAGGTESVTLTTAQLPAHTHLVAGDSGSESVLHFHVVSGNTGVNNVQHSHGLTVSVTGSTDSQGTHAHSVSLSNNTLGGLSPAPTSGSPTPTTNYQTSSDGAHSHSVTGTASGTTNASTVDHTHFVGINSATQSAFHTHPISFTSGPAGSGTAIGKVAPAMVLSWYIKL